MKNVTRLRIAFDFCIHEKSQFVVSVLEIIAFMCLAAQIIYMIASSYGCFDRVNKGLDISVEQLGYYYFDTDNEQFTSKLRQVEGVTHYGTVDSGNELFITHKGFNILRDIQEKNSRGNDNGEMFEGVEAISITEDLWDVMKLKLVEGKKPYEMECDDSGIYPDVLIYLSEEYKEVVQIGNVLEELYHDEKLIRKYIVADFLRLKEIIRK